MGRVVGRFRYDADVSFHQIGLYFRSDLDCDDKVNLLLGEPGCEAMQPLCIGLRSARVEDPILRQVDVDDRESLAVVRQIRYSTFGQLHGDLHDFLLQPAYLSAYR